VQVALARDAVSNLERLGPTFIKLGQILSIRPDVLPPGIMGELAKLQVSDWLAAGCSVAVVCGDSLLCVRKNRSAGTELWVEGRGGAAGDRGWC
jgi:hypothetical protein